MGGGREEREGGRRGGGEEKCTGLDFVEEAHCEGCAGCGGLGEGLERFRAVERVLKAVAVCCSAAVLAVENGCDGIARWLG